MKRRQLSELAAYWWRSFRKVRRFAPLSLFLSLSLSLTLSLSQESWPTEEACPVALEGVKGKLKGPTRMKENISRRRKKKRRTKSGGGALSPSKLSATTI